MTVRNCKTSTIMLLTRGTGRGKRSRERENGKWEQNLTCTLALSVTPFLLILCFVPIFYFPVPAPRSPLPVPRSPFPVPRSPFPVPRSPFLVFTSLDGLQTRNRIQCEFLLLYFFVIRDVFERILLRNGGNNTDNKI